MDQSFINLFSNSSKRLKNELKNSISCMKLKILVLSYCQIGFLVENVDKKGPWRVDLLRVLCSHHQMMQNLLNSFNLWVV